MHFDFLNIVLKLPQTHRYGVIPAQIFLYLQETDIELHAFPFSLIGYLKSRICNSLETNLGYIFEH